MKTNIILTILFFCSCFCHAQLETANWFFGFNAGLTFTTNPPSLITGGALNTYEGTSSASDSLGNLLFYTEGVNVWNKLHGLMPNGTGLHGDGSSAQSALVLPMPGNNSLYFILTTPACCGAITAFCYSTVDMLTDSGLGDVMLKNIALLDSSTEKLSAVRHQNGSDIWIVAHEFGNNNFHAYLLTAAGINPIAVVSSVGIALTGLPQNAGIIKISPNGSLLAMTNLKGSGVPNSTFELFDFNNLTGQVSNARLIGSWTDLAYGTEFSPDNQKLYVGFQSPGYLIQYDVSSGNIANIIASADTVGYTYPSISALQLGPDGKIYASQYSNQSLGCIGNPNLSGNSCSYVSNAILLNNNCKLGLPGFLTSWFNNLSSGLYQNDLDEFNIFPNPFNDRFTISSLPPNVSSIKMFDMFGHQIYQSTDIAGDELQISPGEIANGIYLLEIKNSNTTFYSKIIKHQN